MNDLMWEVTVCNSIEPNTSPVRQILAQNRTYGEQLACYKEKYWTESGGDPLSVSSVMLKKAGCESILPFLLCGLISCCSD